MSWLNGFSTCSKLGVDDCVIWWDAWAAIGTVLAVFVAIFAPAIQRRFFLRKKANAVFAASYLSVLTKASIFAENLVRDFPINDGTEKSAEAVERLKESADERERFEVTAGKLNILADRELDGSKWPAVDLDLILAVAHAIDGAEDIVLVGSVMTNGDAERRNWVRMAPAFRRRIDNSIAGIEFAVSALRRARINPAKKVPVWTRLRRLWRKLMELFS